MTRKYWKKVICATMVVILMGILVLGIIIKEANTGSNKNDNLANSVVEEEDNEGEKDYKDILLESYTYLLNGMFDNCMLGGRYSVDLNDNTYYLDTDFKNPVAKKHLMFGATFGETVNVDGINQKVKAYRLTDGRICYTSTDTECHWAAGGYKDEGYEEYNAPKEELLENYSRFINLFFKTKENDPNFDFTSFVKKTYYKDITYYKDSRCTKKFLDDVELAEPRKCIPVLDDNYVQNYAMLRTDGRIAFISFLDLELN